MKSFPKSVSKKTSSQQLTLSNKLLKRKRIEMMMTMTAMIPKILLLTTLRKRSLIEAQKESSEIMIQMRTNSTQTERKKMMKRFT
jgi:cell division protein FtsX